MSGRENAAAIKIKLLLLLEDYKDPPRGCGRAPQQRDVQTRAEHITLL